MEDIQNKGQDNPNETPEIPEEEKNLEKEALKETANEEIRSQIIENLGLDEDVDTELIDKLVERDNIGRKKLSTAIKQKILKREALEAEMAKHAPTGQKIGDKPQQSSAQLNKEDILKEVDAKVDERLQTEQLNSFELSDELKKEVKSYAELKKISVKKALGSPYIQFMKQDEDNGKRNEAAGIESKHRTEAGLDYSQMKPSDFDMSTDDGRKGFHEYEKHIKKQLG